MGGHDVHLSSDAGGRIHERGEPGLRLSGEIRKLNRGKLKRWIDRLHSRHDLVVHGYVLLWRQAIVDIGFVIDSPPGNRVGWVRRRNVGLAIGGETTLVVIENGILSGGGKLVEGEGCKVIAPGIAGVPEGRGPVKFKIST